MYQTIRSLLRLMLLRLMLLRLMLLRLKTILVPLALIGLFFITTQGALAQSTGTHRVSAGETLATIALRYQTDLPTLLRLNTVANPSLIRVGQILIVPTAIAGSGGGREFVPPLPQIPQPTRLYIARAGDTLANIATHFHTTPAHLVELNHRAPTTRLQAGEPLRVPAAVDSSPPANALLHNSLPVPGQYYVHVVQEDETLAAIADHYATSQRRTRELNRLADDRPLRPGQRLVVPPPSYADLYATAAMGENGVPEYPAIPTPDKWISVDLDHQRLYAWQGNRLLKRFAISSGKAATPTVTGVFRIWAKIAAQTMQGGSRASGDYYSLPNVQWVQYFYRDYALHGAYWHNRFGIPTSRGCINLRNSDAQWLYEWASPSVLGTGWHLTDSTEPATLVIVHR